MLDRFACVMEGLVVRPERMLAEPRTRRTACPFSGRVLLKLVEAGLSREAAYDIVQRNAMRAWETDEQLRDLIAADPDAAAVPASVLDEAFDLADFLRHVRVPFERALSRREEPIDVHA